MSAVSVQDVEHHASGKLYVVKVTATSRTIEIPVFIKQENAHARKDVLEAACNALTDACNSIRRSVP